MVSLKKTLKWTASLTLSWLTASPSVWAQIIPDATLPNPSIVNLEGQIQHLTGGTQSGGNLFHSFEQFNVRTGETAWFDNATSIDNIITRVTGGQISNIDGLIRANSSANLFFLNPNGMVFGPNAAIDIGGSFLASTANRLQFADGTEFSTNDRASLPLLTISVPIGLQFGNAPGSIVNRSQTTALLPSLDPTIPDLVPTPVGLQVQPGNTLALVGGDIALEGGRLSAFGGRIELGAVASNGRVSLNRLSENPSAFSLSYPQTQNFQDILVSGLASIDTSGDGGGSIQLQGRQVRIIGGSSVEANNFGAQPGGTLAIHASELVEVSGTGPLDGPLDALTAVAGAFAPQFSSLSTNTFGPGKGGDLRIDTRNLIVRDGGEIEAGSLGTGSGGVLSIRASESMEVSGQAPLLGFAPQLGQASLALGFGESFLADAFTVSTVSSANGGLGHAGDVEIETGQLRVRNGGVITSLPAGAGAGGQLTVRASELIEVIGTTASGEFASSITAGTFGSGNSGNVTAIAPRVILRDAGAIVSTSFNVGNAGTVTILASDSVEVAGRVGRNVSTLEARTLGGGDAGSVNVTTGHLWVRDGARINVSSSQTAQAGNVNIRAESIELDGATLSATTTAGDRGNIILQAQNLQLRRGSQITTNAGNTDGGNISINTDTLVALENSDITANAQQGRGGQVSIAAQGIFGTAFREQLTPESDITATSELGAEFSGTVTLTTPDVDATAGLVELSSETTDTSDRIISGCGAAQGNSFTITGRGGIPESPTETLRSEMMWEDLRDLIEYPESTGELVQTPPPVEPEPTRELVEATGWIIHDDGMVELVASRNSSAPDFAKTPPCHELSKHSTSSSIVP